MVMVRLCPSGLRIRELQDGTHRGCQLMARFYLDVWYDGKAIAEDVEGFDFETLDLARLEAARAAREIVADDIKSGQPLGLRRRFVIRDESRVVLDDIHFEDLMPGSAVLAS
jgi:hypothetical protein